MSHDDSRYDIYIHLESILRNVSLIKVKYSRRPKRRFSYLRFSKGRYGACRANLGSSPTESSVENLCNRPSNFAIFQISVLEVYLYDVVGRRIARAKSSTMQISKSRSYDLMTESIGENDKEISHRTTPSFLFCFSLESLFVNRKFHSTHGVNSISTRETIKSALRPHS